MLPGRFRLPAVGLAPTLLVVTLASLTAAQHIVEEEPLTAQEERGKLHVPPGFEIQLVASEPDIAKPINLNFDHQGRLYVTQSVEYPYAAKGRGRDAVMRLTIDRHTGRADKFERVVDGLSIPIGVTPIPDGLIVFSIPNIYRCTDTTGDGKLNHREVLYGPFNQVDTHGLNNGFTRWLDGWIYACHGFRNESSVVGKDGNRVTMTSGNTYRFQRDGSRIEHITFGQVNPFGLCFDPLGNIFTADCHTKPAYALLRGAYYPSFGRPHDGLGFGPEIMQHNHGSTGIAGIVYYDDDHFPNPYRSNLFVGNPITRRVNRDRLKLHGTSQQAVEMPDFVVSDDKWFRPVDLQMGPDGALYIADFYNRIIGHYEVPLDHPGRDRHRGRVWRVVYKGDGKQPVEPRAMPPVATASADQLVTFLAHPNHRVRTQATNELVDRVGEEAVAPIQKLLDDENSDPRARAHGLWVLSRLGHLERSFVTRLATDSAAIVRVHLIRMLAEQPQWSEDTYELVRSKIRDGDPFVRRAAADALGRHPHADNIDLLVKLWKETPAEDNQLIHVVRMALRDHVRVPSILAEVNTSSRENHGILARLQNVCLGARTPESAAFVLQHLSLQQQPQEVATHLHYAIRYAGDDQLDVALTRALQFEEDKPVTGRAVVLAVRRALGERGKPLPERFTAWAVRLARDALADKAPSEVQQGLNLARELKLNAMYLEVASLTNPDSAHASLRAAAIDACVDIDAARAVEVAGRVVVDVDNDISLRQKAASALARINTAAAHDTLLTSLVIAPEALAVTIASGLSANRAGGEKLLEAVASGKASARLLQDRGTADALRRAQVADVDKRIAALTAGLPPVEDRLRALIARRRAGFDAAKTDLKLGQKVFTKTCAACHKIGNEGKKIGPELDGIGHRGLDRVLEDVLDPNRNVDGAFRTTIIQTIAGRTIKGLLLRKEGAEWILADAEGKEVRIAESEIDDHQLSPLSPMPANVPELVKEPDFYHLIAFLLTQQQKTEPASEDR